MMWITETDPSDDYRLVGCIEQDRRLYVLVAGRGGPAESRQRWHMSVTPDGGQPLASRGMNRGGSTTDSICVGVFDDAPQTPVPLHVRIDADEIEVYAVTAMPVRVQPA